MPQSDDDKRKIFRGYYDKIFSQVINEFATAVVRYDHTNVILPYTASRVDPQRPVLHGMDSK
jgi:hypothetical protein